MWSDAQIDFVINCLTDQQRALLSNQRKIRQVVRTMCDKGLEIIDLGLSVSPPELANQAAALASRYPREQEEDPLKIQALLSFQVADVQGRWSHLSRRKFFEVNGVILATSLFARRTKEEAIATGLKVARNARWMCNFDAVNQSLREMDQAVLDLQGAARDFWKAKINDLRVESLFTASQRQDHNLAQYFAVGAIAKWHRLKKPVELLHAYLRNAVVERQQYVTDREPNYLHNSIETLNDALNDDVVKTLLNDKSLAARNVLFSLFSDLAKSYAMIHNFSLAKDFYLRAHRLWDTLEHLAPRRELDLIRADAIILEEQLNVRPYPRDYVRLDELSTRLQHGVKLAEHVKDRVLREVMQKDLIPLLILTGKAEKRDQAESLFHDCYERAVRYGLHHQFRGLCHISRQYNLKMNKLG